MRLLEDFMGAVFGAGLWTARWGIDHTRGFGERFLHTNDRDGIRLRNWVRGIVSLVNGNRLGTPPVEIGVC